MTVPVKRNTIPSGASPEGIFCARDRLAAALLRLWLRTLRVQGRPALASGPAVLACWHRDLLPMFAAFHDEPALAMVSASRDADLLCALLAGTSVTVVRGSSSRRPQAARHLQRHLAAGGKVIMALDGPRGPAGIEKPGAQWLARSAGCPLVRLDFACPRALRLPDWSRLRLPLPFARVRVLASYLSPMRAIDSTSGPEPS